MASSAEHGAHTAEHGAHKFTNRLAQEESPYLLQHAHNPVDWYPWGPEAFEKARAEDKPIFLSVGYSTCHWCHVMERESFESEGIATLMNDNYVNIKVDREERPDVDKVYMTYVQATQGSGGWPMSVFLTPDLQPFLGGTYFPPEDMYGRPGFATMLKRVALIWRQQKDSIKEQSAESMAQLAGMMEPEPSEASLSADENGAAIDKCVEQLSSRFDRQRGGFGGAPKFPRPAEINVLLHQYLRLMGSGEQDNARKVLGMATLTLQKMAAGGMHDQLGGGFHRYSVDEFWHVPHFEKMLYDEPQLVQVYLAAYQLTEDRQYAWVAADVLDYMLRDLRHPEGGFFAAEDADSLDVHSGEKKEGEFYIWTADEVNNILGPEKAQVFSSHYYVKPGGNSDLSQRSDPHGEFVGKNCLIARKTIQETAQLAGLGVEEAEQLLAECREALFVERGKRPRPHRDEKVVAAWNGMAIGAFANAARVLGSAASPLSRRFPVEGRPPSAYLQAAVQAARFVRANLYEESTGRLRRSFMRGPSAAYGFSDDYAYMVQGLLELYGATGDVEHLQWAQGLQRKMDELFWDEVGGGWFNSAAGDESILLRMKEDYDGAEPAASSIAVENLWRLAGYSSTQAAQELVSQATKAAAAFRERLLEAPIALPQLCCSLHLLALGHPRQVITAGGMGKPDTEALVNATFAAYAPDKVTILLDVADAKLMQFWRQQNPEAVEVAEATGMEPLDPATAFVCQNFTCKAPTTDPAKVRQLLGEPRAARGAKPALTSFRLPKAEL